MRFSRPAGIAALVFSIVFLFARGASAQQQSGWFIAVANDGRTETNSISFWVGSSKDDPNKYSYTWHRGDPTSFWIGYPNYINSGNIYVNAAVGDHGKNGWFCVDYANGNGTVHAVKHWDFDDSEDHNLSTGDHDDECGPN